MWCVYQEGRLARCIFKLSCGRQEPSLPPPPPRPHCHCAFPHHRATPTTAAYSPTTIAPLPSTAVASFASVRAHTHGSGVGGRRHAYTGRPAAGISDRYSAKSAGRRGEHGYTYLYGWSIARSRLSALSMHSRIRPFVVLMPTEFVGFTPLIPALFSLYLCRYSGKTPFSGPLSSL